MKTSGKFLSQILEYFLIANFGFLSLDIYLAHSVNSFAEWTQWIPFFLSIGAALFLGISGVVTKFNLQKGIYKWVGILIGSISILTGAAGVYYHLHSQFFQIMSIKSLVYTAPFVAPMAYCGLGFLLVMNRMVQADKMEWGQWVLFFALGGFLGNFILALCDHAQNGFFYGTEWIPVVASAFAVTFLFVSILKDSSASVLKIIGLLMIVQIAVGSLGFAFHFLADFSRADGFSIDDFTYGAPIFAPMLFANLATLALLGIWHRLQFE